MKIKISCYKMI